MNDEEHDNVMNLSEHRGPRMIIPTWFGAGNTTGAKNGHRGVSLILEWDGQRTGFHLEPEDAEFLADVLRERARQARGEG